MARKKENVVVSRVHDSLALRVSEPSLPETWDYDESVKKVKQYIYKWRTLTDEIATELWVAREKLQAERGRGPLPEFRNKCCKTWSQYCADIGSHRNTVNRWLKDWFDRPALASAGNPGSVIHEGVVMTLEELLALDVKFQTIYADPPWSYSNQATRAATDNHYETWSVDRICELPVRELAADGAHLHLWTTNAFLFNIPRVMEAWGFTYKSVCLWIKPQMGIGNYWRVCHEFLFFGLRGSLKMQDERKFLKSWQEEDRTRHSAKPAKFRKLIEQVSHPPRLELFGRAAYPGWTVFGNEIVGAEMYG